MDIAKSEKTASAPTLAAQFDNGPNQGAMTKTAAQGDVGSNNSAGSRSAHAEKQPWLKFYTSDWSSDPGLRVCSLAAKGAWIGMLCIMHEATPRGFLLVNGKNPTLKQLAGLLGASPREVQKASAELEEAGVFSRDADDRVFSRRMCRDVEKAAKDRANGQRGGNLKLVVTRYAGVNPPDIGPVIGTAHPTAAGRDKAQIPEARYQKPEDAHASCAIERARVRGFVEFWEAYPKRTKQAAAAQSFKRATESGVSPSAIIAAAKLFASQVAQRGTELRYVPAPGRWIDDGQYLDEPLPSAGGQAADRSEVSVAPLIFLTPDDPEWHAWTAHAEAKGGKSPKACVRSKDGFAKGYWFPTRLPPSVGGAP